MKISKLISYLLLLCLINSDVIILRTQKGDSEHCGELITSNEGQDLNILNKSVINPNFHICGIYEQPKSQASEATTQAIQGTASELTQANETQGDKTIIARKENDQSKTAKELHALNKPIVLNKRTGYNNCRKYDHKYIIIKLVEITEVAPLNGENEAIAKTYAQVVQGNVQVAQHMVAFRIKLGDKSYDVECIPNFLPRGVTIPQTMMDEIAADVAYLNSILKPENELKDEDKGPVPTKRIEVNPGRLLTVEEKEPKEPKEPIKKGKGKFKFAITGNNGSEGADPKLKQTDKTLKHK
jgi:hypothetical protein